MFTMLLADGLSSGLSEKVAGYAIKGLAVGGGFLIGYFIGKFVAWALDRWVFAQKAPDQLKKAVSLVAGVIVAILVALIVFGEGGNGLFGGGGSGNDKGNTPQEDKGKTPTAPTPQPKEVIPPKTDEPIKPPPPKPMPGDVHITILAGNEVKDGQFYLIDDDPVPKTLAQLKKEIAERRKNSKTDLMLIFRFKGEKLSKTHTEMQLLNAWLIDTNQRNYFE